MKQLLFIPVTTIGEIRGDKLGQVTILDENGEEIEWAEGGWEHLGSH